MQPPPATPGDPLDRVDTPALLVDLDAFERNLDRMAAETTARGLRLRPHAKTHKSTDVAKAQIARGAVGLCCQKVSEAEALVDGGVEDLLVSNQVAGGRKLGRLAQLARRARIGVCVDDAGNAADLARAAAAADAVIDVLIEIDVGAGRCGLRDPEAVVPLAQQIAAAPSLNFAGLQAYNGTAQHLRAPEERQSAIATAAEIVRRATTALSAAGLGCETVGGAGTGTYALEMAEGLWTELQPGSYCFMDADYAANGSPPDYEQSLTVLATIMSAPETGFAVCDAGHKACAIDSGLPRLASHPAVALTGASDEHGSIALPAGLALSVGDRLQLIPGHIDPTVNLHDWYVCHRGGRVEAVWPVTARGAMF
ncbi:DSD1 family PLP-dependent enzyme [Algihabitans albus]|uniref:DSD1 family PLP-dependent enzyme n=1 Tax=Algihabitans albus TaxID=2164067 RepID=UPI000E5D994B|nr:DSD1 family PLP-dependent enzyme [Algihabitans albus]